MPGPYAATVKTGTQVVSGTASRLVPPPAAFGEIIEVFVSADAAFSWSSESAGVYLTAGLNPATAKYERTFPIANAFAQLWFKGTTAVVWEARCNFRA